MANHTQANDEASRTGADVEFRSETLYFIVLDRFATGSPNKQREDDEMCDPTQKDWNKDWNKAGRNHCSPRGAMSFSSCLSAQAPHSPDALPR